MIATRAYLKLNICVALLLFIFTVQSYAQERGGGIHLFVMWDERGKFGYMDASGKVVIKPQFDRAYPFSEGFAAVGIGNRSGFIDPSGQLVVPLQYYATYPFSDGVAAVSQAEGAGKNRRFPCGYIDHSNQFVIKPQTKFSCTQFQEGFAVVETYDQEIGESFATYLNKEGQPGVASRLSVGKPFSEGLALIEDFTEWHFVNREGQTVIDLRPKPTAHPFGDRYVPAGSFSEGLAQVGIIVEGTAGYSRFAYMNRKGQIVFKLPEDMIAQGDFHDGRAQVFCVRSQLVRTRIGRETIEQTEDVSARGYIDTAGNLVIPPRFSRVQDFSDGLAVVKVGKGLPIDYYNITPEREKEYADREAKYYSCINRSGVIVIERCGDPLPFDEQVSRFPFGEAFGRGFVDGLYFNKTHVGRRTVYGYQDKTGKYVWIQPHGEGVVLPTSWR